MCAGWLSIGIVIPLTLQGAKSLDVGARTAVFAAADKSAEVREAGNALIKQMLQVCCRFS